MSILPSMSNNAVATSRGAHKHDVMGESEAVLFDVNEDKSDWDWGSKEVG